MGRVRTSLRVARTTDFVPVRTIGDALGAYFVDNWLVVNDVKIGGACDFVRRSRRPRLSDEAARERRP